MEPMTKQGHSMKEIKRLYKMAKTSFNAEKNESKALFWAGQMAALAMVNGLMEAEWKS